MWRYALKREDPMTSNGLYWCMEFYRLPDCLTLRMGGRFIRDFAEHARTLVGGSTLPSKVIMDLSEVNFVDEVGEEVLLWFKEIGVTFAAASAYSHDVCERLRLPIESKPSEGSQPGWNGMGRPAEGAI